MGTMGLALPWEHRIPPVPRDRERRLEPFRDPASLAGLDPAAEAAKAEDSALAAACQAGDLRAYERLADSVAAGDVADGPHQCGDARREHPDGTPRSPARRGL